MVVKSRYYTKKHYKKTHKNHKNVIKRKKRKNGKKYHDDMNWKVFYWKLKKIIYWLFVLFIFTMVSYYFI